MILLDTHVLIWADQADPRLGPAAVSLIDRSSQEKEIAVSAISFWEIAHLHARGRIRLKLSPTDWRDSLLTSGVREIPIDGAVGLLATALDGLHKDPADRLIVATAIQHVLTLMTPDEPLLTWRHPLVRIDARR